MRTSHLRSVSGVAVVGAAALALAGCPRPPRPATVDPAKVTSITLLTGDGGLRYCPHGAPPQLGARVTTSDGKTLDSWMPGHGIDGRLQVSAFEWTTSWGSLDQDARLQLPYDPIAAMDRDVTISARLADRPDLVAEITLSPDFGCGGAVGDAGAAGTSGWSGAIGASGPAGASGRDGEDATSSQRAGDGEDGGDGGRAGDGGHGSDGGPGGPGPEVEVALTRVDSERHGPLVAVLVMTASGQAFYLHDPDGQPFSVLAVGGAGGAGGRGGDGGRGGMGGAGGQGGDGYTFDDGSTEPGGRGGRGGNGGPGGYGGDGGNGGDGGDGGRLRVIVDARFPELSSLIGLSTRGGAGGYGGGAGGGGYGGDGGRGGYGGSKGGSDGSAGAAGSPGTEGRSGQDGRPGRDGPPPIVEPGDVSAYFGALLSR